MSFYLTGVASVIRDKNELEEKRLEKKIQLDELIRLVSDFVGIEESEVFSKSRRRIIGKARALMAYFSILEMGYKGTEVGRALRIKGPPASPEGEADPPANAWHWRAGGGQAQV